MNSRIQVSNKAKTNQTLKRITIAFSFALLLTGGFLQLIF
jgi:hypothetical protein